MDRTFYVENLSKLTDRQLEAFIEGWEQLTEDFETSLQADWNLDKARKEVSRRRRQQEAESEAQLRESLSEDGELRRLLLLLADISPVEVPVDLLTGRA